MNNDGNDYTVFLVAAAVGYERIRSKDALIQYDSDQLKGYLNHSSGFLHLILKTVKRILDHDDLIVLLFSKFKLNEGFKSMVAACCDCQLFKGVTLRPSFNQTIGRRRELQS